MSSETLPFAGKIIGSGMLARAFQPVFSDEPGKSCIYAAGVSNSGCIQESEFKRERARLTGALQKFIQADPFVYFGTCSAVDPDVIKTPYVQHKLAMENLVKTHPRHLIFRLPQVAGKTPNPHTLLNFMYARIARSEQFTVWNRARRNIIDVDDMASIARQFIADRSVRNITLNIANPVNYSVIEIVRAMEIAVGKPAIYDLVNRGSVYTIDIHATALAAERAEVFFSQDYLSNVTGKYYGNLK
jgi:nucleoside-diphosphate-sugar epimerase